MSATVQALRAIPELQAALSEFVYPIPFLYAIPNARRPPGRAILTRLHAPYATFIRRCHVRPAVFYPSPSTQCL